MQHLITNGDCDERVVADAVRDLTQSYRLARRELYRRDPWAASA